MEPPYTIVTPYAIVYCKSLMEYGPDQEEIKKKKIVMKKEE